MNPVPLPTSPKPAVADNCAGQPFSFGNPPVSGQVWFDATQGFYIVPAEEVANHVARLIDKKGK